MCENQLECDGEIKLDVDEHCQRWKVFEIKLNWKFRFEFKNFTVEKCLRCKVDD
jgi:hypothetical protein